MTAALDQTKLAVDGTARWTGVATGGAIPALSLRGAPGAIGRVQFGGTFGSATVTLQGSLDGTTFVTLKDLQGSDISVTAAGQVEFSTAAMFLRPGISGGTNDSVTVLVRLVG